jgi:hypothetical protein
MVEAGNLAGTDGTPPQVPPNSVEAGSEGVDKLAWQDQL